jgi:hypothetical protein
MKKIHALTGLAVLLFALALPPAVNAAEFVGPHQESDGVNSSNNVVVLGSETHHNLYTAAGAVTIDGTTTGDLYAAGGTVLVNGKVEQDAIIAGGTILLKGGVGGDVRVFGGTVNIVGPIGGDLLIFGGNVTVSASEPKAGSSETTAPSVGGDVVACAGNLILNGSVGGHVLLNGGSITINSKVAGTANTIRAGKQLVFGPHAAISNVSYTGAQEPVIQSGADVHSVDFHRIENTRGARHRVAGLITLAFLVKLLAWIAAGLVLLYFLRRRTNAVVETMRSSPWGSLGIGFLAVLVIPIITVILLLTVVGYYVAFLLIVPYIFFLGISCLTAAIFTGAWAVKLLTKKTQLVLDWQAVVIGVVVFAILGLIPVVGWIAVALLCLIAFGAYVRWARGVAQSERI